MRQSRNSWWIIHIVCVASAVVLLGAAAASAQEHGEEQQAGAEQAEVAEHEEHEFHRHHLAVFLGATTTDIVKGDGHGEAEVESTGGESGGETERVTEASIGVDYEYRLSRLWGAMVGFEYVGGDARNWMAGLGAALHPVGNLKLMAGPGLERHEGESEFLFRVGVMYDFAVGSWSLTPALNVDFVDGDQTYVYGIYVGKGF